MKISRLHTIITRFPKKKILVVGDVMLDEFLWGKVSRISPEAPVPVVEVTKSSFFPGGAANVARNLRALGAPVAILGVVGDDRAGADLRSILDDRGVDTTGLLVDPTRPTTVKTRIVAHHQQVVRFDRENCTNLDRAVVDKLTEHYRKLLNDVSGVIFEDYNKGVLTLPLLNLLVKQAQKSNKITTADPNARRPQRCRHFTAITPNRSEAFSAAGITPSEPSLVVLEDEPLLRVGKVLLQKWQPQNLLITLGEQGMCLFRRGKKPHHIPTVAQEVFDVSGAGDTVIGTLTLALVAGSNALEAAEISNHAGGIVVGKVGTATCSPEELLESFRNNGHPKGI